MNNRISWLQDESNKKYMECHAEKIILKLLLYWYYILFQFHGNNYHSWNICLQVKYYYAPIMIYWLIFNVALFDYIRIQQNTFIFSECGEKHRFQSILRHIFKAICCLGGGVLFITLIRNFSFLNVFIRKEYYLQRINKKHNAT